MGVVFFLTDLFKQQYMQFISYMKSPQYKVTLQQEIEKEKVCLINMILIQGGCYCKIFKANFIFEALKCILYMYIV